MSASDEDLYGVMLKIENKDIFVDLRRNPSGTYLKLSERTGTLRKTVLIPASGILRLQAVLGEVAALAGQGTAKPKSVEKSAAGSGLPPSSSAVYVSGLPWSVDDAKLAAHFSSAGRVVKATVLTMKRRDRVVSKGCGVVQFATEAEAANAIAQFNDTMIDDRRISCREDRKASEGLGEVASVPKEAPATVAAVEKVPVPTKVFVRSLAWATTDESLQAFFSKVGRVVSAKVRIDRKGRSAGTAVVEFSNASEADAAITMLDEKELDGRVINVRHFYEV